MRIVAVIASYGRGKILQDTINCLKKQVHEIVIVGSTDWSEGEGKGCYHEKRIAFDSCLDYVDHKNSPLGVKWQAGLNKARLYFPDAVLICGSDDFIFPSYVEDAKKILDVYSQDKQVDVIGMSLWYVYNAPTCEMIQCSYKTRKDFIGAGRIIRKNVLDACGWQIFPTVPGVGCDLYSYEILKKHTKHRFAAMYNQVVSVKGTWACMDTWDQIKNAASLKTELLDPKYTDEILKINFPDVDFGKYAI